MYHCRYLNNRIKRDESKSCLSDANPKKKGFQLRDSSFPVCLGMIVFVFFVLLYGIASVIHLWNICLFIQ